MTIGERIKQRREELNMTQDELAKLAGYRGKAAISRIETSKGRVSSDIIMKLAPVLHTTPEDLLGIQIEVLFDSRKLKEEQALRLMTYYQKMTESKQKQLIDYAKFLTERKENDD